MGIFLSFILMVMLAVGSVFGFYNGMVSTSENVDSQWHQVENQMQRRYDLIPNLVETVKGYAKHEKEIFEEVSKSRQALMNAKNVSEIQSAEFNMNTALGRLFAISERYPDLKANQNFRQLQDELAGTENRIAVARRNYNEAVRIYNTKIKSLPYSLFAAGLGFTEKEYFKVEESKKEVPKVSF